MEEFKTCPYCGQKINVNAKLCKYCKKWVEEPQKNSKNFLETVLLCWFLGAYGFHRFYTGHYAIGIAQLLTLGGCGIWSTIDLILICLGKFKDSNGILLNKYDNKIGKNILLIVFLLIPIFFILVFGLIFAAALLSNEV